MPEVISKVVRLEMPKSGVQAGSRQMVDQSVMSCTALSLGLASRQAGQGPGTHPHLGGVGLALGRRF